MLPGDPMDALAVVKEWDPVVAAVISTTPPGTCFLLDQTAVPTN